MQCTVVDNNLESFVESRESNDFGNHVDVSIAGLG